ncbi:MAG TPA: DNA repair protein RecN [Bacteroidia bacterium]|nr:DNA repair protein RecN [Bacteroidia bacterium]
MLKRLVIQNFALIEEMDVRFPGQLTVITGETGAGKSIFLEALGLALGKRADLSSLRNKLKKCIVEAEFDIKDLQLQDFFRSQYLDYESVLVLRREISAEGKSRCFLNEALVSVSVLKELAEQLVDIHSQHQTLNLNKSEFQFDLLDTFAGCMPQRMACTQAYLALQKKRKVLHELEEEENKARKDQDYYDFLFKELSEAEINPGTLAGLEEQSAVLENAGTLSEQLNLAAYAIQNGEQNLLSGVSSVRQNLHQIIKFGEKYRDFHERLNAVYIELKELGSDIEHAASGLRLDPAKLDELNQKMDQLNRLLKKHQASNEIELLRIKADIEQKLQAIGSLEEQINACRKDIQLMEKDLNRRADELSAMRRKAPDGISKRVQAMLVQLGMEHAVFRVELSQLAEAGPKGKDELKFLFSANKGEAPGELQKIASGGELSRLMLSLKALLAERKSLPSIVFDEIDTGVSGEVADRIGSILSKMGEHMQVISITHLPQIACKGKHHLFVYKNQNEEKTMSHIRELKPEERTVEIAKMLSTGKPTESAIKNAKELLRSN